MKESAVEAKCRKYAMQRGWIVYKLDPTGNRAAFDRVYEAAKQKGRHAYKCQSCNGWHLGAKRSSDA